MGETLTHRIRAGVDDVARRVEIRFADFEMNNVATRCFQCFRFHQNFERSLGPEARHAFGKSKFAAFSHGSELKCQSGSDHYSAVVQVVFPNGSGLALIAFHMKTIRLSTSAIFLSLAFTSAALAKEKDEESESDNEVSIEKVTLVRDAGDKFEPVKSFKPTDTFGALVKLSEAKTGTRVKGVWTAVDAGGLENKKIFEKEVTLNSETLKGVREKDRVDFTLSHDNPYPAGDYKIDIYLNGELAETVEFKIE